MTASLCGPSTKVIGQENGFSSSINAYMMAVCDPGGGKTVTYENVVEPVMDNLQQKTGKKFNIDNYTQAGLHKNQMINDGYGMITSDEGHRFLSTVNAKQSKGEAERSNLCKMWGGKGDFTELAGGSRGFKKTSLSILLYIQPHPLMAEMANLTGVDGFLDRFLFFVSRPVLFSSAVIKESYAMLSESKMMDFVNMYQRLYEDHKNGKTYKLSHEAQENYNEMQDAFAEYLNEKYEGEKYDDENKENDAVPCTQTNLCMTSSKDTQQVLRLAVLLQVTSHYILSELMKSDNVPDCEVNVDYLNRARKLYCVLAQQKSAFVQAVNSMQRNDSLILKKVPTFRSRVLKAILTSRGPLVTVRDWQRHLKGSLKDSILSIK